MSKMLFAGALVLVGAIVAGGCGTDSPTNSATPGALVRTVPVDGQQNVDADDPIHMMFNEPVDTMGFHNWFYCVDSMQHDALMDSLTHGMMGMGGMRSDSLAFYERMHDRAIQGDLHWNVDGDSCTFIPDSDLDHDTEYVLRMTTEMQNRSGSRMRHMGEFMSDDLTIRFRTKRP